VIETAGDLEQARCGPIQGIHGQSISSGRACRSCRTDGRLIAPLQFLTTLFQVEQAQRMGGLSLPCSTSPTIRDRFTTNFACRLIIAKKSGVSAARTGGRTLRTTCARAMFVTAFTCLLLYRAWWNSHLQKLFDLQGRSICACILN
jgi:hypothetical protein